MIYSQGTGAISVGLLTNNAPVFNSGLVATNAFGSVVAAVGVSRVGNNSRIQYSNLSGNGPLYATLQVRFHIDIYE